MKMETRAPTCDLGRRGDSGTSCVGHGGEEGLPPRGDARRARKY